MKAVIMNSADKIQDNGNGYLLGMTRDVEDATGALWTASIAYTSEFVALDPRVGVGHLNANRALRQFSGGKIESTSATASAVPQIGWDYANTNKHGAFWNEYVFEDDLPAGSFVSITATWDREINILNDNTFEGVYNVGETFDPAGAFDEGFNNTNIYLLPKDSTTIDDAIWSSSTSYSNTEHLFFEIPATGQYEFWVYEAFDDVDFDGTDYAVAWWAYDGPISLPPDGDFDGDGIFDLDDINLLANNIGSGNPTYDLNFDGVVDSVDADELIINRIGTAYGDANLDYSVDSLDLAILDSNYRTTQAWAGGDYNLDGVVNLLDLDILGSNFGFTVTPTEIIPIPEPCTFAMALLGALGVYRGCYRNGRRVAHTTQPM